MDGIENSDSTAGVLPEVVTPPQSVTLLQKRVVIALPWYRAASALTAFAVAHLMDKRRTSSMLNFGDAFITHSRNSCVDSFLKSDADYMLMLDDDMIFPIGNAKWFNSVTRFNLPEKFAGLNTIDRLLSHKKTLVGGLYFGRWPSARAMYGESAHPQEAAFARSGPHDAVKPTKWVATGCLLTHRNVFLDIEARFPLLSRAANGGKGQWFSSSEHDTMNGLEAVRKFLAAGPMDGIKCLKAYEMIEQLSAQARANSSLGMGEDVSFCIRAKQSGHQPHVDLGLICGHVGECVYGPMNTNG